MGRPIYLGISCSSRKDTHGPQDVLIWTCLCWWGQSNYWWSFPKWEENGFSLSCQLLVCSGLSIGQLLNGAVQLCRVNMEHTRHIQVLLAPLLIWMYHSMNYMSKRKEGFFEATTQLSGECWWRSGYQTPPPPPPAHLQGFFSECRLWSCTGWGL